MPRYFFTVEDGRLVFDPLGEDITGPEAARRAAVQIMSEVMPEHAGVLLPEGRLTVTVSDDHREEIFSVITTTATR